MKKIILPFIFCFALNLAAQVESDKPLILTGTGIDAKVTGIQSVTTNQDAISVDALQKGNLIYAGATGSANNLIVNISPAVISLQTGMVVNFISNQNITGIATINVNGLGQVPLKKYVNQDLEGCEVINGQAVSALYDGTNFQIISVLYPGAASAVPLATAASGILQNEIAANWNAASNATGYYLDVATDAGFTIFVSGFNNLSVGNVTSYPVTGLTCGSTYYYRVRSSGALCGTSANSNVITATTAICFSCGGTLTDTRDSQTYPTVFIGGECWMAKNLNYGTQVTVTTGINQNAGQKYCTGNNASNCTSYGGLYEWPAMMNGASNCNGTGSGQAECSPTVQGICPSGWHIPSHYEWVALTRAVCTSGTCATDFPYNNSTAGWPPAGTTEGTALKTGGSSGFNAPYGGSSYTPNGGFYDLGSRGYYWSSTFSSNGNPWYRFVDTSYTQLVWNNDTPSNIGIGFSVRCVQD